MRLAGQQLRRRPAAPSARASAQRARQARARRRRRCRWLGDADHPAAAVAHSAANARCQRHGVPPAAAGDRRPPDTPAPHLSRRARHHQHAARRMGQHLADHLADQQVGQQAGPAAAADDDQVGGSLARLVDDLAIRLGPAAYPQTPGARPASRRARCRRCNLSAASASARAAISARPPRIRGCRPSAARWPAARRGARPAPAPRARHRRRTPSARWPAVARECSGGGRHRSVPPAEHARRGDQHHGQSGPGTRRGRPVATPTVQRQQRHAGTAPSSLPAGRCRRKPSDVAVLQQRHPAPAGRRAGQLQIARHRLIPQLGQALQRHLRGQHSPRCRRRS